jgi:hypothetical protein
MSLSSISHSLSFKSLGYGFLFMGTILPSYRLPVLFRCALRETIDILLDIQNDEDEKTEETESVGKRGYVEIKFFRRGEKVYGGYKYLRFWENGVYRSLYLGKAD